MTDWGCDGAGVGVGVPGGRGWVGMVLLNTCRWREGEYSVGTEGRHVRGEKREGRAWDGNSVGGDTVLDRAVGCGRRIRPVGGVEEQGGSAWGGVGGQPDVPGMHGYVYGV